MKNIYLRNTIKISIALMATATLIPYIGSSFVLFEVISHFKLYLLFFAVAFFPIALYLKSKILIVVLCITLVTNLYEVAPVYLQKTAEIEEENIHIITSNIRFNNPSRELALDYFTSKNPDILLLQELNFDWNDALEELQNIYPHHVIINENNNFGVATFSKYPIVHTETLNVENFDSPSLITDLNIEGKTLRVINVHPTPPITQSFMNHRDEMYEKIGVSAREINIPIMVAGDFNSTVFSPAFKRLVKNADLKIGDLGFGYLGTFPMNKPNYKNNSTSEFFNMTAYIPAFLMSNGIFTIPIDHVLVSEGIEVQNVTTGTNIHSDHLPLEIRIGKLELVKIP